ncbi:hypothetical protein [Streptomyces sp. NRRL B-1347]|uniref:hypothetical protein n=1 Tax=Streptomyces sp. NRRL B-1347 TaxID=1476877 RepID=UPI0004CB4CDD|nr:hypothetical protein [Streptomyces sp. NRRL B-1347]
MSKRTDLRPAESRGVTDEQTNAAGWVLASVAYTYRTERPEAEVDELSLVTAIGARAYEYAGRSYHGGTSRIARLAHDAAPAVYTGVTRGVFAGELGEAARRFGFEWDDANEPAIPKLPVPGPRRTGESGRVPAPRPEKRAGVPRS